MSDKVLFRSRLFTVSVAYGIKSVIADCRDASRSAILEGSDPVAAIIGVLDAAVTFGGALGVLLDAVDEPLIGAFATFIQAAIEPE